MNIREIERLLNMPRANIRCYEREGLLRPAALAGKTQSSQPVSIPPVEGAAWACQTCRSNCEMDYALWLDVAG